MLLSKVKVLIFLERINEILTVPGAVFHWRKVVVTTGEHFI